MLSLSIHIDLTNWDWARLGMLRVILLFLSEIALYLIKMFSWKIHNCCVLHADIACMVLLQYISGLLFEKNREQWEKYRDKVY